MKAQDFDEMIHSYTREQAIEDGVLVDISSMASQAGWRIPVAVTAAVWSDCVFWSAEDEARQGVYQDQDGRLWDLVWMAFLAAKAHVRRCERDARVDPSRCAMTLWRVPRHGPKNDQEQVALRIVVGPGDGGQPVATIMAQGED